MKVLRFYTDWCKPCHVYEPIFRQVVVEERGMAATELDADSTMNIMTCIQYGVSTLPTTVLLTDDGDLVAKREGFMNDGQLRAWLDEHDAH